MTCLHLAKKGATLYPEHFLNEEQQIRLQSGKMRFIPGPSSVIEESLLVGFVGRREQTGHPAQKPLAVMRPLILMATKPGDTVLDPMCGSGTTGVAALGLGRNAILCDVNPEYLELAKGRLSQTSDGSFTSSQSRRAGDHRLLASVQPKQPALLR